MPRFKPSWTRWKAKGHDECEKAARACAGSYRRRNAPGALIEYADTVTEMVKLKHAFDNGIKARAGIEF